MQTIKIKFDESTKTIALLVEEGAKYSWEWVIAILKNIEGRGSTRNIAAEDATVTVLWDEDIHKLEVHYDYKFIKSYSLMCMIVDLAIQQAEWMRGQARIMAMRQASAAQMQEHILRQQILKK